MKIFAAFVLLTIGLVLQIEATPFRQAVKGSDVLDEVPLIDGHNDFPWRLSSISKNVINSAFNFDSDLNLDVKWQGGHTDLPRMRTGKVGAQFWSAYVGCSTTQYKDAVETTLEQIDVIKRLTEKYPNDMTFVTTSSGIMEAFEDKKFGSLIGVEGGHSIDNRLAVLRMFYDLGVRYMTLTHSCNQPWIDASPIDDDLTAIKNDVTDWGQEVILEMNRIGMMIDLSHVSHGVMTKVLEITRAPVIFSHSSSWTVFNHHRNVHDDILELLKTNNGIIMVNFYTGFIGGNTIDDVISHLNHIKNLIGIDHIGIGADYDGVDTLPIDLEDVSKFPNLFDRLAESGHGWTAWTTEELKKLAGLNLIRVMGAVETVATSLINELPHEKIIPFEDLYNAQPDQSCRTDFDYVPTGDVKLTRNIELMDEEC